jgi:uncharacterized tellurite resistance protein B-like protein
MFLAMLNDEQKKAFLAIALKIVHADGRLEPKERRMIEAMRYEMGLLQETALPHGSIEELAKPFDTRKAQSILMMEGIGLALADTDFSGEEKKILRALALIFNISEQDATEMENWVLEFKKLQEKAGEIFAR